MSEPAVDAGFAVLLLQDVHDIIHVSIGGDPSVVDIREVMMTVGTLLETVEPDRTPERLDVTKHLATQRPDAGHPIAVEAPDQIMSDQIGELVS